jgi:hypothetical protein
LNTNENDVERAQGSTSTAVQLHTKRQWMCSMRPIFLIFECQKNVPCPVECDEVQRDDTRVTLNMFRRATCNDLKTNTSTIIIAFKMRLHQRPQLLGD